VRIVTSPQNETKTYITPVQAVDRALLVDTLPPSQQASANAWAARMLGVGSVVGFFMFALLSCGIFMCLCCLIYSGNINLPSILPFLGKTQLEVLSVVVSLLLLCGHLIMAIMVKERVLCSKAQGKSLRQEVKDIWSNMRTLPRVIRQIVGIFPPYLTVATLTFHCPVYHTVFVRRFSLVGKFCLHLLVHG
jgi:solute carrier family 45 protein 1/2/4